MTDLTAVDDYTVEDWIWEASAHALASHVSLVRRDEAIRRAVALGASKRKVARETGLTPPAIDRILARAGADNLRW